MNTATLDEIDGSQPVSDAVLRAAIAWQLRLGDAVPADRAGLQQWLGQHPSHARAWRQLAEIDDELARAGSSPQVRSALTHPGRGRASRAGMRLLGVALAACITAAALDRLEPVSQLLADYRSGTGEIRTIVLPDATVLHLDSRSAVDLAFDDRQRAIVLRAGRIAIETRHADSAEPRPFVVLTPQGSLRALGTRFVVEKRDEEHAVRTVVTQSAVAARPAGCASEPATPCAGERILAAGQSLELRDGEAGAVVPAPAEADAWKDGMLVVENRPLSEVVAELARYRPGLLGVDSQVAGLRVTGTLPLADTDKALLALTAAVPVEVASRTRWWVTLRPRTQADRP